MQESDIIRRLTTAEFLRKHKKDISIKEELIKAFEDCGNGVVAQKLRDCCKYEDLVCCNSCGHRWWVVHHCDLRVCPVCSHAAAIRRSRGIMALAATAKAPKMLTLTMPRWQAAPREGIKKLRAAILELRKTNLLKNARAGAYTIELVPKKDGWHIHAHMIVDVEYVPFKKLIAAWSHCIKVKGAHVRVQGASAKAVQSYICKYACKAGADGMSYTDMVEWYIATKGSRLWATWGAWYGKEAAAVIAEATDERPQAKCPYCGSVHTMFMPKCGFRIWGDDWKDVYRCYCGDEPSTRIIQVEVEEVA